MVTNRYIMIAKRYSKVHHDWYMTGTSLSNKRNYEKGQEIMWLQLPPVISINQSISINQEVCCLFGVVFIILNFVPYDHCCHFYATVFPTLAFVFIVQAVLTLFSMKYTSKKVDLVENQMFCCWWKIKNTRQLWMNCRDWFYPVTAITRAIQLDVSGVGMDNIKTKQ